MQMENKKAAGISPRRLFLFVTQVKPVQSEVLWGALASLKADHRHRHPYLIRVKPVRVGVLWGMV